MPEHPAVPEQPDADDWLRSALRVQLEARGASFYRDLLAAAGRAAVAGKRRVPSERQLLDALWDLVWAGQVTNDTFAPLRALRWPRTKRQSGPRPRFGSASRMGPPEGAGRWSLVSEAVGTAVALAGSREPSDTERRHALATRLLERYGVVTRDGVAGEAIAGGFSQVYPVLRELEEHGRVRRGYFVEGLGGAQFALPGAVDRLRAERGDAGGERHDAATLVLAAADPANPYGTVLSWPRHGDDDRRALARAAGAYVVLHDGEPVLYLERGGRSLQALPQAASPAALDASLRALAAAVADGRLAAIQVERVNGTPVAESRLTEALTAAGFRQGYRGWALRAARA
ncbi:MAG: hypothetical protein H0W07_09840 [Chloroflexi bacterium]|nr:hypothetical protein [Chloroflexota bacterium]